MALVAELLPPPPPPPPSPPPWARASCVVTPRGDSQQRSHYKRRLLGCSGTSRPLPTATHSARSRHRSTRTLTMKAAMLLVSLLALACLARALPVEPDVLSSVDDVHANDPADPRLEEADVEVDTLSSDTLVRARRSPFQPRPGQQGPQGQQGQGQQGQGQSGGSVSGGVHRERGVGTVVHAQGERTWHSGDGRTSVGVHGQYERVVRGPARGRPNYNVGVRVQHRF